MINDKYIQELIEKSKVAQNKYEKFSQEKVDSIVRIVAKVVYDRAEELADIAVKETQMGVYEDKVAKNKGKSKTIWNNLKDKKTVGIIETDETKKLWKIAKPKGVVGAVTPCTNPIVTPMCNIMFALKGRNSIIIAPHPRAKKCSKYLIDLFNYELSKLGAPENLIQLIEEPSIELSLLLMKKVDVIIATGGMDMVKSAYSSGKPAYGVGAGNVQCIIDRDMDIENTVENIIKGRIFDNGIICSGEQSIIVPKESYSNIIEAFRSKGAFYSDDETVIDKFEKAIFNQGHIKRDVVGQSVKYIARSAGVEIPDDAKVIILRARGIGNCDVLCKEKMCPVMVAFEYDKFEDAVEIAKANLEVEGKGHSCAIHSKNKANIEYLSNELPVSRIVINQPSSTSAGGSLYNAFAPTTTLGCGSWGNNGISENLDYIHLINISQAGFFNQNKEIPSDIEIWN